MISSGIDAHLVDVALDHDCGFAGITVGTFDPEVDRDAIGTTCPGCGADVEVTR